MSFFKADTLDWEEWCYVNELFMYQKWQLEKSTRWNCCEFCGVSNKKLTAEISPSKINFHENLLLLFNSWKTQATTVFTALYCRGDFSRHCIHFLKGRSSTSFISKLWTRGIILVINQDHYAQLRLQDWQVNSRFKCFSSSGVDIRPFNKIMNKDLFRQNLI